MRTVEDECPKSRAVEEETRAIKKKQKEESSLLLFLYACMHSVCTLYASPTAYIYSPSALRTRLFAFLYALYAVNSGVVFPHRVHRELFDAYNAYNPVCTIHRSVRGLDAGTHMADTRSPGKRLNPGDKRKLTRTRHPSGVGEYSSILESGRSGNILGDLS